MEESSQPTEPHIVHLSRAIEPVQQKVSLEVQARHNQSVQDFPWLNLSESEFIISVVHRHPIGLLFPVATTSLLVMIVGSLVINYPLMIASSGMVDPPPYEAVVGIGFLLIVLFLIGGYIAIWVYTNNRFFLTNESVIQEIQTSLFSKHEQTVSLSNIEDASYRQHGVLQTLLNYGSIRLSTEGDETTYRFYYVSNPKREIAVLNNVVEAFKNGRPVVND